MWAVTPHPLILVRSPPQHHAFLRTTYFPLSPCGLPPATLPWDALVHEGRTVSVSAIDGSQQPMTVPDTCRCSAHICCVKWLLYVQIQPFGNFQCHGAIGHALTGVETLLRG